MSEEKKSSTAAIKHFIKTHENGFRFTKTWIENGSLATRKKEHLYKAPTSHFFNTSEISESAENFLNECNAKNTGIEKILALRHKRFSSEINHFTKQNPGTPVQLVLIGCGYSSYATQKNKRNINFFEIESDAILKEKIKIYMKNKIDPNATYIGIDNSNKNWYKNLASDVISKGADPNLPTCFILEAEIAYLNEEEIKKIFKEIKQHFPNVSISFNYISPEMAAQKTNLDIINHFTNLLAKRNLFFSSGFDPKKLKQFAEELGLNFLNANNGNELAESFGVDSQKDPVLTHFGVCTMGT